MVKPGGTAEAMSFRPLGGSSYIFLLRSPGLSDVEGRDSRRLCEEAACADG